MANAVFEGDVAPAIHSKPQNTSSKYLEATNKREENERHSTMTPVSSVAAEDNFVEDWGFDLNTLYKMAKLFFRQNEGKAFHITYEDKLRLIAYTQQEKHGAYDESKCKPVGYLDLIGQDRREAWMDLGDMESSVSKQEFIALLHDRCPLFRPFVFAHKASASQSTRGDVRSDGNSGADSPSSQSSSSSPSHQFMNESLIRSALNKQTLQQFSQYASQQCPGDLERQQTVIRQLQDEHFKQYMRQLAEQSSMLAHNGHERVECPQSTTVLTTQSSELSNGDCGRFHEHHNHGETGQLLPGNEADSDEEGSQVSVSEPTMWTRKDIVEFKDAIRRDGADCIIKVGHGETVTVRVPTHDDGQCLYWEFTTDHYDIGFGVYFEWTKTPGSTVSVHISDSEEESNEEDDENALNADDIEAVSSPKLNDGPPTSVIIPIYRRDSHQEVYVGRHQYPGQGIYLLKFDNSYSLWRGKTLYYRVYYSR